MNKFFSLALRLWFVILMLGSNTALSQDLSWSSASNLSAVGEHGRNPRIATSDDGTRATAIWYRYDGENFIIQSASATIEKGISKWGSVTDLTASGNDAQQPNIAISSDGTKVTAVWYRNNGAVWIAQSASATIIGNVATWGSTSNLSADGQNANPNVQIGLSSNGTEATAVWSRFNGSILIVQSSSATISENVATWGSVTDLSAVGAGASENDIALSSDGTKATAVWHRSNGSNKIIQSVSATIIGNTATWSAVTDLSATGGSAFEPLVELSSDGTVAAVIWARNDGSNDITQSAIATISGNAASWGSVSDLSAAGVASDGYSYGGHIALSLDGTKVTAAWNRYDGSFNINQSASATIIGNTANWGSPVNLSAGGSDSDTPDVKLSSDGLIAVAVWPGKVRSFSVIQTAVATIIGNTATWRALKNISLTGQDASDPKITLSTDGKKATAIWTRNNGTDILVQSASAHIPMDTDCFVIKSNTGKTMIFCL